MDRAQDDFDEKFEKMDNDMEDYIRKPSFSTKVTASNSIADQNYEEVEEMKVMTKSEGLISDENLLLIWGTKFPKSKVMADKAIHHALLQVDSLAQKGMFRIIYFHSDVYGKGSRIPKLI